MIEFLESSDHVVAMRFTSGIVGEDIEKGSAKLDEKISLGKRASVYAELSENSYYTADGLLRDVVESVNNINKRSMLYRAAVVTDKGWLGALARLEGLVFSSIDIRVFSLTDKNAALAWVSEAPPPLPETENSRSSLHFIKTTEPSVIAYEMKGRITSADVHYAAKEFGDLFDRHDDLNVLIKMADYTGFDLSAIFDDEYIKTKFRALQKVKKVAIVGATPSVRNTVELIAPVFGLETKVFDPSDEADAWLWIGAQPALLTQ